MVLRTNFSLCNGAGYLKTCFFNLKYLRFNNKIRKGGLFYG